MSLKNLQTKAVKLMDHADVFAGWEGGKVKRAPAQDASVIGSVLLQDSLDRACIII